VAASKGRKAMIKRMIVILVLVGAVLAGVFGFKIFDDGQVKAFMASKGTLFVGPAVYVLLAADDSKKGVTDEAGPISPAE
jgi:hypothetical protein